MSEADGGNRQVMEAVYDPLLARPPRDFHNRRQLPKNGINVFYERDELAAGTSPERVTRVGMNTAQGRFPTRIRQHYGRVRGLGGNKNGSVFRKHVGGTPLRRHDPDDARLDPWLATRGGSYPEVEEAVSQFLRGRFTFRCFTVNDTKERLRQEEALIALFAQHPLGGPSPDWLGHHAANGNVMRSGLWNAHKVDRLPLTRIELRRLEVLVRESRP